MDCKAGDLVHILANVEAAKDDWVSIRIRPYRSHLSEIPYGLIVHSASIVAIEPRPIPVGDTVRAIGFSEDTYGGPGAHMGRMKVAAVVDGRAWCRSSGYDYIIEVEKLERVS